MADYLWSSPGGAYVVPADWKRQFLSEFPDYRVRWSLRESCWHIEQSYGVAIIPPCYIDEAADDLVRARDGYWLVMAVQPGDRMACPGIITKTPMQRCGNTIKLRHRRPGEVACQVCRKAGRDGRVVGTYWPFDESLLEYLRRGNPLTWGVQKVAGKTQSWAAVAADRANAAMMRESERQLQDRTTSIDAVDYRWISGIASSTGLSRRTIDEKDLE